MVTDTPTAYTCGLVQLLIQLNPHTDHNKGFSQRCKKIKGGKDLTEGAKEWGEI